MKKTVKVSVFLILFAAVYYLFDGKYEGFKMCLVTFFELAFLAMAISTLLPGGKKEVAKNYDEKRKLSKGSYLGNLACVLIMPLTALFGVYFLGDRKYYFISFLLIIEMIVPFLLAFEGRKSKTGELVLLSVLSALAVLGRCAFYMLPQFKPTLAIVIVAGAALGGETGFLVGAISAFVSNIFFGQGPWTPWQMLASGVVGLFAGVIFKSLKVKKSRLVLCVYGGISTVLLYGGILNPASVIMYQPEVTQDAILTFCIAGLPFDLIHAESTVFFLWLAAVPMLQKIERVKTKYGV